MKTIIQSMAFLILMLWNCCSMGFSATYFYELYLHNEYYAEPPGFPNKLVAGPLIASFYGEGDQWHEKRLSAGIVEALRLVKNNSWIEFIAAYGKESMHYNHAGEIGKASHKGWDDFLIDFGHNFLDSTGKRQLMIHWLTGIPIARSVTLAQEEDTLWGTRTYATGPVIEIAYDFIRYTAEDLFIGCIGRFLHRFKRSYEPILPPDAIFHPGTAIDILALFHYRYYGQNFEMGYVYTRYDNISYEFIDHFEQLPTEKYNSIYLDYFYFYDKLSLGFELNVTKTFGEPYDGITTYILISWYF